MDNGFEYISDESSENNQNSNITNEENIVENITNDITLPDWDLLPPFDEVERGEVE